MIQKGILMFDKMQIHKSKWSGFQPGRQTEDMDRCRGWFTGWRDLRVVYKDRF